MSLLIDAILVIILLLIVGVIALLILMAFTTGFKNTGRRMGGLNLVFGPPSNGKSYIGTEAGLDFMERSRRCFSNYIIRSVDGRFCSRVWKKEYMHENLTGSVIIWDEMQVDFWSRMFKDTTVEQLAWFTQLAQYEITIYMMTQHYDNLEISLRRVVNWWIYVEKVVIPILDIPLYFNVYTFDNFDRFNEFQHGRADPYFFERLWFNKDVAAAYDTKFFAKDERPPFEGQTWEDYYKEQGKDMKLPDDISLKTYLNRRIQQSINTIITILYTMAYSTKRRLWNEPSERNERNLEYDERKSKDEPAEDDTSTGIQRGGN